MSSFGSTFFFFFVIAVIGNPRGIVTCRWKIGGCCSFAMVDHGVLCAGQRVSIGLFFRSLAGEFPYFQTIGRIDTVASGREACRRDGFGGGWRRKRAKGRALHEKLAWSPSTCPLQGLPCAVSRALRGNTMKEPWGAHSRVAVRCIMDKTFLVNSRCWCC